MTRTDLTTNGFTHRVVAALAAAAVLGAAISVAVADEKKGGAVSEAAMKEAQEIFSTRCSVCHGTSGKGDGRGSAGLNPQPRNVTDPEWQKSVKLQPRAWARHAAREVFLELYDGCAATAEQRVAELMAPSEEAA